MRCLSVVLSLLLLAGVSQAQFTVGLSALAAGAGAVALGGAALGALGLAAAASRGRRRGGRRVAFRRGRRFRGRRAVLDQEAAEDAEEESAIWGEVAAADQDGCALKLICLLEAAGSDVDDDDKEVLSLFGDLETTDKAVVASKLPYEAAGWLGKFRGSDACEAMYGVLCPYNKKDMMKLVSSVWSSMTKGKDANAVSA